MKTETKTTKTRSRKTAKAETKPEVEMTPQTEPQIEAEVKPEAEPEAGFNETPQIEATGEPEAEIKREAEPQAEAVDKPELAAKSEAETQAENLWKKYQAAIAGLPFGYTTEEEVAKLKADLEQASKPNPESLEKAKIAKEAYQQAKKKAEAAKAAVGFGFCTEDELNAAQKEMEAAQIAWKDAEKNAKGFSFKKSGTTGSRSKGPMSGIEAAFKILSESDKALRCKEIAETAIEKGLWAPEGQTPEMTLSAAIQGEIKKKGENSRFVRIAAGLFTVRKPEAASI